MTCVEQKNVVISIDQMLHHKRNIQVGLEFTEYICNLLKWFISNQFETSMCVLITVENVLNNLVSFLDNLFSFLLFILSCPCITFCHSLPIATTRIQ